MRIVDHAYDPQRRVAAPVRKPVPKVNWNPWTVGDMDRLAVIRTKENYSAEDIAMLLSATPLATTPERISKIASAFGIQLRQHGKTAVKA